MDRETNPLPVVMVTAMTAAADRLRGVASAPMPTSASPTPRPNIDQALAAALARKERLQREAVDQAVALDLSSELAASTASTRLSA